MIDRTTFRQIMGLCIMLLSVTGCTALGATANPSPTAVALAILLQMIREAGGRNR